MPKFRHIQLIRSYFGGLRNYGTEVELTSKRYKVTRGNYASLTDQDVNHFKSVLEKSRVVTDETDLEGHNVDWLHMVRGKRKKTAETLMAEGLMAF